MKKQKGFTTIEIIGAVLILLGIVGYGWNLVKICGMINDPLTLELVLRVIAIFVAPLGAIIGYF